MLPPHTPGLCGMKQRTQDFVCSRHTTYQLRYIPSPGSHSVPKVGFSRFDVSRQVSIFITPGVKDPRAQRTSTTYSLGVSSLSQSLSNHPRQLSQELFDGGRKINVSGLLRLSLRRDVPLCGHSVRLIICRGENNFPCDDVLMNNSLCFY